MPLYFNGNKKFKLGDVAFNAYLNGNLISVNDSANDDMIVKVNGTATSVNLAKAGASYSFAVEGYRLYSLSTLPNWITISGSTLTTATNETGSDRTATITATSLVTDKISNTITIKQYGSDLPYAEELDYIETIFGTGGTASSLPTSGCGFNLQYIPDFRNSFKMELKVNCPSSHAGRELFGSRPSTSNMISFYIFPYSTNTWYWDYITNTSNVGRNNNYMSYTWVDTDVVLTAENAGLTVTFPSGTGYLSAPSVSSSYTFASDNPIWFSTSLRINGTTSYINEFFQAKLYYFKATENDVLLYDMIPVLDNDGVPCLYDKVNMTLIYAQGSDTPLYGRK